MSRVLLKCGHADNAIRIMPDGTRVPSCAICACEEQVVIPDLSTRQAKCSYGMHAIRTSNMHLAFFEHRPQYEYDEYYCGCHGWE